jgi:hypothetical protein
MSIEGCQHCLAQYFRVSIRRYFHTCLQRGEEAARAAAFVGTKRRFDYWKGSTRIVKRQRQEDTSTVEGWNKEAEDAGMWDTDSGSEWDEDEGSSDDEEEGSSEEEEED